MFFFDFASVFDTIRWKTRSSQSGWALRVGCWTGDSSEVLCKISPTVAKNGDVRARVGCSLFISSWSKCHVHPGVFPVWAGRGSKRVSCFDGWWTYLQYVRHIGSTRRLILHICVMRKVTNAHIRNNADIQH